MTREALRVELVDHHHLSAAAEREDEMEDGACCNVELACGLVIWHLSATEDEALLRRRNTRLLLDFLLDPSDLIIKIDVKLNLFACKCFYLDEHLRDADGGR